MYIHIHLNTYIHTYLCIYTCLHICTHHYICIYPHAHTIFLSFSLTNTYRLVNTPKHLSIYPSVLFIQPSTYLSTLLPPPHLPRPLCLPLFVFLHILTGGWSRSRGPVAGRNSQKSARY